MNETIVENFTNNSNPLQILREKNFQVPPQSKLPEGDVDVASLIRFMEQMNLPKFFMALPDGRQQSKTTYSLGSLALWAFATCVFRQGAKNALHTTLQGLSIEKRQGICRFLGITGTEVPHYTTVDDALANVDCEKFNDILLALFAQMNERKFFYNHAATLLPNGDYYIGTDGYHLHTYTQPHAVDKHGHNACPYCLPRKRHAGTEREVIYWVHTAVTFVLICKNLTIPLFLYPLKSQQINANQSNDKLKQECELTAAHAVLPLIRNRFPKLKFTFLGDALYANRPFLRLCAKLKMDYIIVRKEKTLTQLGRKCDELAKLKLYQTAYSHQERVVRKKATITRKARWFNNVELGDGLATNVLRFEETAVNLNGEEKPQYKGEWICSKRLSKTNCIRESERGRMRWNHEDFHNTCKHRGFNIKHDMARANPNLLFVWKFMTCIAFFVFELFSHCTIAKKARGTRSLMKFAKDMLQELVNIAWARIWESAILKKSKVQFRFCFEDGP